MLQALLPKKKSKSKHTDEGKHVGSKTLRARLNPVGQTTPKDVSIHPPHEKKEASESPNTVPAVAGQEVPVPPPVPPSVRHEIQPSWSQLVLDTTAEFLMVVDEQQTLMWSQPGKDEVANSFAQGIIRDASIEESGILDLLLGQEQAKTALDTVATNKNWQGSLTVYCHSQSPGTGSDMDNPPQALAPTPSEPMTGQASEQSAPGVGPWGGRPPSDTGKASKSSQQWQPQLSQPPSAPVSGRQQPQLLSAHDPSEQLQQEPCGVHGDQNSVGDLLAPLPFPSGLNTFAKQGSSNTPPEPGLDRQLGEIAQRGFQTGPPDLGTRTSASGSKPIHRESESTSEPPDPWGPPLYHAACRQSGKGC
ncbi:hypothetical protein DUNSADRAFT_5742 [Dunaliella salina]|uniref:Uncharacterized protein n=1 Tax=Dunaliella salina TaxID=3046 RepID=A0ABQ7H740_DUNSA|nr:hypothetical protein DUNSADRAFT_5742 [Dunaliella salina]|eukprot:KAF5842666.1 hypothetical protein DUNSADRAFT_5742 [Dunaliella salina]